MKKLILLLCMLASAWLNAQGHEKRLSEVDVKNYHFQVELFDESDEISVAAELEVEFLKEVPEFVLDLVGEKDGKGMKLLKVEELLKEDWGEMKYRHADNKVVCQSATPIPPGQVRNFRFTYRGIPADGLIISKNRHGNRTFFGDNWPNRAQNWLISVDHPSDKAGVEWEVTVPDGFQVIANGLPQATTKAAGKTRYHYLETAPVPTKVMVFAAADFVVDELPPINGVPVSSWVFPEDRETGFEHYADAAPILKTFMDSIAPYAYGKLANVQSKTRYGGMENASAIFYYESSVDKKIIPLLAHELAHQWFGNMATEANWHHIWLSEGFATYFTDLYIEWSQDKIAFRERMSRERDKVIRYSKSVLRPVVDETVTNYNQLLNANSYEKGAWVLHMLRTKLGHSTFMQGIRSYYGEFAGGNALSSDFQRVMEEVSGKDLSNFFDQWLFQAGHPKLLIQWKYVKGKKEIQLNIEQVQKAGVFDFPLCLSIGLTGGNFLRKTIHIVERKSRFKFKVGAKIEELFVDPEVHLLGEFEVKK